MTDTPRRPLAPPPASAKTPAPLGERRAPAAAAKPAPMPPTPFKAPAPAGSGLGQASARPATLAASATAGARPARELPPATRSAVDTTSKIRQCLEAAAKREDHSLREFAFSPADFERVRALIYQHAGIALSPLKQDMVYSRLARRLRARGEQRFSDYLDKLEAQQDSAEWEQFVNALTTNLTSFFRESHHFDVMADFLRRSEARKPFKIWCSAASTGEEPYSIAITACEALGSMAPPVQIIASDLDTNVLNTGALGIYGEERVERLPREQVQRFFLKGTGEHAGKVRVRPELQRLINFRRVNLLEASWSLQGPFDMIFCRNVMIYFDKPTQHKILERFVPLLKPEGLLFAGHSENFMHAGELFKSLGRTVYARADKRV